MKAVGVEAWSWGAQVPALLQHGRGPVACSAPWGRRPLHAAQLCGCRQDGSVLSGSTCLSVQAGPGQPCCVWALCCSSSCPIYLYAVYIYLFWQESAGAAPGPICSSSTFLLLLLGLGERGPGRTFRSRGAGPFPSNSYCSFCSSKRRCCLFLKPH